MFSFFVIIYGWSVLNRLINEHNLFNKYVFDEITLLTDITILRKKTINSNVDKLITIQVIKIVTK